MILEIIPGEVSLIVTVPHDGGILLRRPSQYPFRPLGPTRREAHRLGDHAAILPEVCNWGGYDHRDLGTREIGLAFGSDHEPRGHPTIILFNLHRAHVDVNREPQVGQAGTQMLTEVYEAFHQTLDGAVTACVRDHACCLLLDIHGYTRSPYHDGFSGNADLILGTAEFGICPRPAVAAFAAVLRDRGYTPAFSPDTACGIHAAYRGGWIVRRCASVPEARVFGIQVEIPKRLRQPSGSPMARILARDIREAANAALQILAAQ